MTKQLDQEWIDLITQAKQQGLTVGDIQKFLEFIQKEESK